LPLALVIEAVKTTIVVVVDAVVTDFVTGTNRAGCAVWVVAVCETVAIIVSSVGAVFEGTALLPLALVIEAVKTTIVVVVDAVVADLAARHRAVASRGVVAGTTCPKHGRETEDKRRR
jgi:hypothetical protein